MSHAVAATTVLLNVRPIGGIIWYFNVNKLYAIYFNMQSTPSTILYSRTFKMYYQFFLSNREFSHCAVLSYWITSFLFYSALFVL